MDVPARFAGAPLRASQKPVSNVSRSVNPSWVFLKGEKSLVAIAGAFLSETAGAGNGLITKTCTDG
jgi:hypothetical protein